MVEFAVPGVESHTLVVYIDHNMGGLVKDAFIAGPLQSVREELERSAPDKDRLALRELDLAEARARVKDALEILDHTFEPPVDEDVRQLRALMCARIKTLPEGGAGQDEEPEVTPEERERLLADFLDSPEGRRWRGMKTPGTSSSWRSTSAPTTTTAVRCAGARSSWRSS